MKGNNHSNGWFRLIATSAVISTIITSGVNYFRDKNKQEFEIKKESIQKKLVVLERMSSNLDLLESRLFALKIMHSAVAAKVSGAPSQHDLQIYAVNAGLAIRVLSDDVGTLETGGEARAAADKLLANLAGPLNQAQATPMRLESLIAYLDTSFTADV